MPVSGQKDILFEIAGLSTTPKVGDALGFTTVGLGYSDFTTYIIRTVTNYDSGTGRATINIAPGKGAAPASFDGQAFKDENELLQGSSDWSRLPADRYR